MLIKTIKTLNFLRPIVRQNFFWNKKTGSQQSKEQKLKEEEALKNEWKGKEEFLKQLQKQREEYEKLKREENKIGKSAELREKREYEVNYGKIDYAKIMRDNINIRFVEEFKHPEELFNFLGSVRVKLTEENIIFCINAFIRLANFITEKDLEKPQFIEFLNILGESAGIISSDEAFISIFQFLDIYCVKTENPIWQKLEIYLFRRIDKLSISSLVNILKHLGNQREGTDQLWDTCEQYLKLETKTAENAMLAIKILVAYWKVKKGTKVFITELNQFIYETINNENEASKLDINSWIQLASIQSAIGESKINENMPTIDATLKRQFEIIERYLKNKQNQMNFEQHCLTAQGFGFHFGSDEFLQISEKIGILYKKQNIQVSQNLEKCNFNELKLIIHGFLLTYRGSNDLFHGIKGKIIQEKIHFSVSELAAIVKAYHITENEDQEFYHDIEKIIVSRLKDIKYITIEEIYETAKSYLITRIGSRELYKLLEIVIKFRFDDLKKNQHLAQKLHDLYVNSGLCSPDLIERFQICL